MPTRPSASSGVLLIGSRPLGAPSRSLQAVGGEVRDQAGGEGDRRDEQRAGPAQRGPGHQLHGRTIQGPPDAPPCRARSNAVSDRRCILSRWAA